MGLFDKVKNAIDTAADAINKSIETKGPMTDPIAKKYYDIVFNLLLCVRNLQKQHIQAFIKSKLNEECPEETLDKVLQKFHHSVDPKTNETWYSLASTPVSYVDYRNGRVSCFNKEEIYNLCFAGFEEEIRLKFADIFKIVKEHPSKDVLEQGISKIKNSLSSDYPDCSGCSYSRIAVKIIGQEIANLFNDGDCLIRDIISNEALTWLKFDYKNHNGGNYRAHLYAFALRALHYEKSDKTAENYVSITEADCRDAVNQSESYQDSISKRLFDNKDDIINSEVKDIFESHIILAPNEIDWMYWVIKDVRLIDFACFLAWEKIMSKSEEIADNLEDTIYVIHNYIKNNAK